MKIFFRFICPSIIALLTINCSNTVERNGNLVEYIPENTTAVYRISNWDGLETDLNNNGIVSAFQVNSPLFSSFGTSGFLKNLHPKNESLLCINVLNDSVSAYTFISKEAKNLFQTDSIKNKTIETLTIDKHEIQRITLGKEIIFSAVLDSVYVASSSQKILQNILEGKTEKDKTFLKIYNIRESSDFTSILKNRKLTLSDSLSVSLANWFALETEVLPDALTATGIALARDTIRQLLDIFKGQLPQQNSIAQIIPTDAKAATAFCFSDAELLQKNLKTYRKEKDALVTTGIFESVNEIAEINLKSGSAIILKSIDPKLTDEALARFTTQGETYREVNINSFSEPNLFIKTFSPLVNTTKANYFFNVDSFFVFIENESIAQSLIADYKNGAVLQNAPYFESASNKLSSASSLLVVHLNENVPGLVQDVFGTGKAKKITLEKFPMAIVQLSYDRDFAHVNFVCKESASRSKYTTKTASEELTIKLDNAILGNPQFFSNHRTKGKDIVVQDVTNKLYLISEKGKVLWTRTLDAAVLGNFEEVDLLKNGNKQLAFATKNTFYIIDRNGKDVAPFPIKLKDRITQPLAVFDYDTNRDYRFIITQGKNILMYDSSGKTVKGFAFTKAKSNIALIPQHFRMGNKDYITIAEENGTLNILSRTGQSRISISKKFDFAEIPIAEEDKNFVVITKDNNKVSISESGKITTKKLNVSSNFSFVIQGNMEVTLDDNLLRINENLIELPLGLYTFPQIFTVNKKTYIVFTETQEKKVYVYDTLGNLLSGFPIYGNGNAIMDDSDKDGKANLIVRGDDNSVILYGM